MTTQFVSIEAFYADNPARRTSGEADYGVHWTVRSRDWPRWRVSYVQATGEIYATPPGGKVLVLGVVPADPVPEPGTARWDYDSRYYKTLDGVLEGWADPDVSGHDLAWIENRLADYQPAAPLIMPPEYEPDEEASDYACKSRRRSSAVRRS